MFQHDWAWTSDVLSLVARTNGLLLPGKPQSNTRWENSNQTEQPLHVPPMLYAKPWSHLSPPFLIMDQSHYTFWALFAIIMHFVTLFPTYWSPVPSYIRINIQSGVRPISATSSLHPESAQFFAVLCLLACLRCALLILLLDGQLHYLALQSAWPLLLLQSSF